MSRLADRAEARLERDRERRGRARRQRDLGEHGRPAEGVGPGLVRLRDLAYGPAAEDETRAMVDIGDDGAEVVGVGLDLALQHRAGHREVKRIVAVGVPAAFAGDVAERRPERGQEPLVAVEQRRRLPLHRVAQQVPDRAGVHPDVADRRDVAFARDRDREHGAVDAAGAGPGDDVDAGARARQGRDRGVGAVTAAQPVELAGDTAHPHGEADAAVHDNSDSELLLVDRRCVGHALAPWCQKPALGTGAAALKWALEGADA